MAEKLEANNTGWVCKLCGLKSLQQDEASYLRHLSLIHGEDENGKRPSPEWDAARVNPALSPMTADPDKITQGPSTGAPLPLRALAETGRVKSFGSGGIENLSIQPTASGHDDHTAPLTRVGLGPAAQTASDEAARLPHSSRQSPSARPSRQIGNRSSPTGRASTRVIRPGPQPPQEVDGFSQFTSQTRPQSREQHPIDDESRELKRKGTVASSQPSTPSATSPRQQAPLPRQRGVIDLPPDPRYPNLILQPDSRGISQEQLATEVRAIYSGLTSIESRCIKLVKEQSLAAEKGSLSPNIWRGLISLHRALLNDHHDFFLASQHPSAAPPLHRLAVKYNMPARMWKHGIHSFLEMLRHQLPASLEYMISFIYLAYQMMSLLLETVPSFEDTWIECLGDLSRYRMAVEEEEPRDRETWCNVAKYWYGKAADRMPNVGRLYHHLAILARPNALQQVYLYSRSLISAQPFQSARESIQTVFDPLMKDVPTYIPEVDAAFIKTIACIFHGRFELIEQPKRRFHKLLDGQIGRVTSKWREFGVYIAGTSIGALLGFGNKTNMLTVFEYGNYILQDNPSPDNNEKFTSLKNPFLLDSSQLYDTAADFFFTTFSLVLERPVDKNTHPFLHVVLSFVLALARFHTAHNTSPELQEHVTHFTHRVPWTEVCRLLNMLAISDNFNRRFESSEFLRPEDGGPLPEDYLLRGLVFTQHYFPSDFFVNAELDDERLLEVASTTRKRAERLMWIGYQLAQTGCFLYNSATNNWAVNTRSPITGAQDVLMEDVPEEQIMTSSPLEALDASTAIRPSQLSTLNVIEIPDKIGSWTTMVIDLQMMVAGEVFPCLVRCQWTVLIPTPVWKKLHVLAKQLEQPNSQAAHNAVAMVRSAVEGKKDVKIVNQSFDDVTQNEIDVNINNAMDNMSPTSSDDDDEETLVKIATKASAFKKQTNKYSKVLVEHPNASPAALVSDSDRIASKARTAGLVVIASEVFRSLLKKRGSVSDAAQCEPFTVKRIEGPR